MSRLAIALAFTVAAVMIVGAPLVTDDVSIAKKSKKAKALVACPAKVGGLKLEDIRVSPEHHDQTCDYVRFGKNYGQALLNVSWSPDEQGERTPCTSRQPEFGLVDPKSREHRWQLESGTSRVWVYASSREGSISAGQAAKAARKLVSAAEPLGHPCVPAVAPTWSDGVSCPLLLPNGLVRADWYYDSEPYAIESLTHLQDARSALKCHYLPAYSDEGSSGLYIEVQWLEGPAKPTTLCLAKVDERGGTTSSRYGYHPVQVNIHDEFVNDWGGQALADGLAAAAAARTERCADAPDGSPPYADATTADTGSTETTIILSGGPGDAPPAVGEAIELPEDDQHTLVVGGPDGEVIREEYIGAAGTIAGYGPTVTDADGNWSVMATVDVEARSASPAPTTTPASPLPSSEPTAEPTKPAPDPSPLPSSPPTPAATPTPEPDATPTPAPPTGPPDEGAIRNVQDHIEVMGEMLDDTGTAERTIPPSDIEALVVLKPDYAKSVTLGSGSIIVDTSVGKIHVTPIIGANGLIEVRLSRFTWLQSNDIIKGLVRALNAGVADRGGRFRTISVTPEGISLTAEGEVR